jgi:putative ABC transport system ATP-binding protein
MTRSTRLADAAATSSFGNGADSRATAGTVRLRGVKKKYVTGGEAVAALRGIDLDIDAPGFYGIMGPSGSGKSTLLHLLAALDRPDEGSIEVSGQRIDALSERDLTLFRRRSMGIVFQQFNLI